jgi:hypothetical protein
VCSAAVFARQNWRRLSGQTGLHLPHRASQQLGGRARLADTGGSQREIRDRPTPGRNWQGATAQSLPAPFASSPPTPPRWFSPPQSTLTQAHTHTLSLTYTRSLSLSLSPSFSPIHSLKQHPPPIPTFLYFCFLLPPFSLLESTTDTITASRALAGAFLSPSPLESLGSSDLSQFTAILSASLRQPFFCSVSHHFVCPTVSVLACVVLFSAVAPLPPVAWSSG